MIKVKLTKISDDHFNGNHPNGINTGYEYIDYMIEKPTMGKEFVLYRSKLYSVFHTSIVIGELNKDNEFKTAYSTYKLEYLDNY